MSEQKRSVAIHVPVLARVEGEGALDLRIDDGDITQLRLRIFEPPRFFEKFLEGRSYTEIPDMVARICGICPVAYQVTAAQALERLFGVELSPWARAMRRVFYCGEWIQSHSLHIHLLAAPDFFGCSNAIELARIAPEEVRRGLRIQTLGNELMDLFGARSVHPVGVRVGGFHGAPSLGRIRDMRDKLRAALPQAEALIRWAAAIPLPADDQAFVSVAMRHPDRYAIETGDIAVSDGLLIGSDAFDAHFAEQHEPHSTALFSTYHGQAYLVGPLARLNLNRDRLPDDIQALLAEVGFALPSRNLFHSLLARAVETLLALREALCLLDAYQVPESPWVPVTPRAGVATGCTEAPRGLLWHRYEMDADGRVINARIVPPTSQNQGRIEEDLRMSLLNFGLDQPDDALRLHCEKVIRNYDPCISCATHFLRLNVERT
jgi:coenzyme F420-reducing hydrogenase alpha subunit